VCSSDLIETGISRDLSAIFYAQGLFVVVGANGTILTSSDAETFTQRISGTSENLQGISFGNTVFVAVGSSGTILNSDDGIKWTTT
jgi:photosystem II stability/assembly factor-like uncharacterized protein